MAVATPFSDARLAPARWPAILDLEASGFGRASYPIEVGYVLEDGTSFCSLIRPAPDWTHWDPAAERIHGISRATLETHGRDIDAVTALLNERLRGLTLYTDGWANDYPWLALLFDEADRVPTFRLESLRALLSEDEAQAWQSAKHQVARELNLTRHRASTDARLLQLTLQRLRGDAMTTPTPSAER